MRPSASGAGALSVVEAAIAYLSPLMRWPPARTLTAWSNACLRQGGRYITNAKIERLTATLQALSPLAVLARGYSICRIRPTDG
jgi:hypothetical protein